jgi:hypothetical protein
LEDARLVRDLLDANLRLTEQFTELARLAVGAPHRSSQGSVPTESNYGTETPVQPISPFEFSNTDDWEDIPEEPLPGTPAQVIELPRRPRALPEIQRDPDLPIHISEEEEDLRYSVGMGLEAPQALTDLLKRYHAPGLELQIAPIDSQ